MLGRFVRKDGLKTQMFYVDQTDGAIHYPVSRLLWDGAPYVSTEDLDHNGGRVTQRYMEKEGWLFMVGENPVENPFETQHGGNHYKGRGIEPLAYILANELDFCEGNIVKYITRYKDKGGKEDLEKIKHYVDFLIQHHYGT